MHAPSILAAALVAFAPAVQAVGTAYINNFCKFPVYVFPTGGGNVEGPFKMEAGTGTYSQKYRTFAFGGMSMKLSKTQKCEDITQFEYTLGGGTVFYDISNVDCYNKTTPCPFQDEGMHMTGGSDCPVVTCAPGDPKCYNAYNLFNDDWATKGCSEEADTTLNLCATSDGAQSSGDDSSAAPSPSPSPSPAAAPSQAPQKAAAPEPESVAAAAVPTSSSAAPTEVTSAQPTTLATSIKAKPSVAAPETTEAPAANIVYTTEIAYTTQWATKWVEGRSVHEDFHHHVKPRSPHAHARRHQPYSLE